MSIEDKKEHLVYKHTSPSGKSYIGVTKKYNSRCRSHQYPNPRNSSFYEAIQKHGWDNFTHEILESNLTQDEAYKKESFYIEKYNSISPYGYNLNSGGKNPTPSSETIIKLCKPKTKRPDKPLIITLNEVVDRSEAGRKLAAKRKKAEKTCPECMDRLRKRKNSQAFT